MRWVWLDYHLHEFRLCDLSGALVSIGIPTGEEEPDRPVLPGWNIRLAAFFERSGWHAPPALYTYDFGDDWEHALVHEGTVMAGPPQATLAASPARGDARPRTAAACTATPSS